MKIIKEEQPAGPKPSREEAEEAVRTLLRYTGDNPAREGLVDTPARVVRAYEEFFAGYAEQPHEVLGATFAEYGGYEDFVLVKSIAFTAHCEHHMLPITGVAHVAYWPHSRVVGISKLARIVDTFAKRLTMQEKMTAQVAEAIEAVLRPKGVAVLIDAEHQCMSIRGAHKPGSSTVTSAYTGIFRDNQPVRDRFLQAIR
jgi:GTP cyclohydrolase I